MNHDFIYTLMLLFLYTADALQNRVHSRFLVPLSEGAQTPRDGRRGLVLGMDLVLISNIVSVYSTDGIQSVIALSVTLQIITTDDSSWIGIWRGFCGRVVQTKLDVLIAQLTYRHARPATAPPVQRAFV